jgi:hypothetical protein
MAKHARPSRTSVAARAGARGGAAIALGAGLLATAAPASAAGPAANGNQKDDLVGSGDRAGRPGAERAEVSKPARTLMTRTFTPQSAPAVPAPGGDGPSVQGEPPASGAGGYGRLATTSSRGQAGPDGTTVYPGTPGAREFNTDAGGWAGYEEYSPLCWVRGITCVNWHFSHPTSGGPTGAGDGFLRINGTSLGLAPCTPQAGIGRWTSPLFAYSGTGEKDWNLSFDMRQSYELYGDGHAGYAVEVLDEAGRVVTTASPPEPTVPLNQWLHRSVSFDGSKLVHGKQYRISIKAAAVHAETAGSWGNIDIDNIAITTSPKAGPAPVQACRVSGSGTADLAALLTGRGDLCPTTRGWGRAAEPMLNVGNALANTEPIKSMLDTGRGAFAVVDLAGGQFIGWGFPKEGIPGSDPRDMIVYTRDGTIGEAGSYAILFFTRNPQLMMQDLTAGPGGPGGAMASMMAGQMGNAQDLMADPGRLIDLHPDWSLDNVKFLLDTVLDPIASGKAAPQTALGGRVWGDGDHDGIMNAGEAGVKGVKVALTNSSGDLIATQTTGADGRYEFVNIDPTSDPEQYHITFAPASLPGGMQFTTQYSSTGPAEHSIESTADPKTGATPEITLARGQQDLTWNAGLTQGSVRTAATAAAAAAGNAAAGSAVRASSSDPGTRSAAGGNASAQAGTTDRDAETAEAGAVLPHTGAAALPIAAALLLLGAGAALVGSGRRRRNAPTE